MQEFERYFENLGWKRLSVILIVIGILLCLFLFFSIFGSSKSSQSSQGNSNTAVAPTQETKQENGSAQTPTVIPFKIDTFTIQYPQTWKASSGSVSGGGTITEIRPPGVATSGLASKVTIQVLPASHYSVADLEKVYLGGFQKSSATIDGVSSDSFSGKIGNITEQGYVFQFQKNVFLVKYIVMSEDASKNFDKQFQSIISSIHLLK